MFRWLFGGRSGSKVRREETEEAEEDCPPNLDEPAEPLLLPVSGDIVTDTACIAVFDIAALSHRADDDCDWWADPKDELEELRARNLLIIGLGADGLYAMEISDEPVEDAPMFSLRVPSGTLFVGPGEEISGAGWEPDGRGSGFLISIAPGDYAVSAGWRGEVLRLGLHPAEPFDNPASEPILL